MNAQNGHGRILTICILATLIAVAICVQFIRIQNMDVAQQILDDSKAYQGVTRLVYPNRGNIYDAKGRLLAGNETTYEVGLDLNAILNGQEETIASAVSEILGMDYDKVLAYAMIEPGNGNPFYIQLDGFVSPDKILEFEALIEEYKNMELGRNQVRPRLNGLMWTAHNKRSYPEGTTGSNILGFYKYLDRTQGMGYFGVEETYNTLLAGTPQMVYTAFDPQKLSMLDEIPAGADIELTFNREIQAMAEQELDEAIEWSGAKGGTILIYNPKNGEIIAMANTPRLDPNEYWNYGELFPNPEPFNPTISKTYEPGSVFKAITVAIALDTGAIEMDTIYSDDGAYEIGGVEIRNWDYGAYGDVDMTDCMRWSLNTCLAWMAEEIGPDNFYRYLKAFGFDRNTGIDLGGETHWPLKLPGDSNWYEIDLATNAFGQGISVTPIQMAMTVGALANEGKMYVPHVVKAVIIDGKRYEVEPVLAGTPVSAETARQVTAMLTETLMDESYENAYIDGYTFAGKTGTGQIPTEYGYTNPLTNASFVGWGPSEDPQVVIYVWMQEPTRDIWGSQIAAPIFSKVVEKLVVLMDIPPDSIRLLNQPDRQVMEAGE